LKTILIVDDEKSFLLSLRDGLSIHRDNYQVLLASDGREAIDVLRSRKIDLLITDLKLPVLDGFEILAYVTRNCPKLAVIVMTAFGTPEIESRLARMDSLQYLEKPLDFDILEQSIFTALTAGSKSYIRGISLPTFLQLVKLEQKNCTIKVSAADRVGYLYLRRGDLVDAQMGELGGDAAALEIFSWEDSEIEMDGICRRQDTTIEASLEFLLMEAFRIKDERAHAMELEGRSLEGALVDAATKTRRQATARSEGAQPAVSAEKERRQRLLHFLNHAPEVIEYALFDEKGFLERKSAEKNSMLKVDPSLYLGQVEELDRLLQFGTLNYLCLNTKSRTRYLLMRSLKSRVFVRLRPGLRPLEIMKSMKRFVNG